MGILEDLKDRGFVENTTHEDELNEYLNKEGQTCYIGFDPTASSLHVGSLVCIMVLAHMQKAGHRPIALVGGGTGLIGDPSGKTEMRNMITKEDVDFNKRCLKDQLSHFIDFKDGGAELVDNADWLTGLGYIDFLRDVGRHFSVNRMVKAESYKMRLDSEEGLSFIEFNYMLLQAYDFMKLAESRDCLLQMGGSDQWGNIVAGIDLVRKMHRKTSFGITFPLITTSSGAKMGKTASGAVWLDSEKTPPYEYYQFWINTDDKDVEKFLLLFTFLPKVEIDVCGSLEGSDINSAKAVLAFEATKLCHGEEEAIKSFKAAVSMFGGKAVRKDLFPTSSIPREVVSEDKALPYTDINSDELKDGIPVFKLFVLAGLAKSSSASRKLIQQGGAYLDDERVASFDTVISENDFKNNEIILRSGKKRYHKLVLNK
ncbi:MAG: tyrosine--tRNA ligase [Desulfobacterales bacterium]|nr:tyrosine--tRNA ligase [Desulfobacterales bacterium]MCP4162395.1 tyrosine--tRNA ligase [Deltaproteobacteria bacterium]